MLAAVVPTLGATGSLAAEKNVTDFIVTRTAVPYTVNREWKKNCPAFFCGTEEQKKAEVLQVHMDKIADEKIKVRGIVIAEAAFGVLNPLDDKQLITVAGEANPVACTFKLEKLGFSDGVAQFLVDFFSDLDGKVYPFKDSRGKCDQYFPSNL